MAGTSLLEREAQLLRLLMLLVELGLKLPELRQLCLLFRRVHQCGWSSRCSRPYRGCRGLSRIYRGILAMSLLCSPSTVMKHSLVGS